MTYRQPGNQNLNSIGQKSLEASMDFNALLEASSLGTPAVARIRTDAPASVVDKVRRRVNRGGTREDIDPGEHVRDILARMEASGLPAGPRRRVSRFFLTLAGIVPEAADKAAPDERARLVSIGAAILITSVLAVVSMWFALTTLLGVNGLAATPLAVMWGLVMLVIDRWLVVSVPVGARGKLAKAVPRLVLAMLLGTAIAVPVVLHVFHPEINARVAVMQDQHVSQLKQQISAAADKRVQLNNEITVARAALVYRAADPEHVDYNSELRQLESQLSYWIALGIQYNTDQICPVWAAPECSTPGDEVQAQAAGGNSANVGWEVARLRSNHRTVRAEIAERDKALAGDYQDAVNRWLRVQAEYYTAKSQAYAPQFTWKPAYGGILTSLRALGELADHDDTIGIACLLLFLLLLAIECLPVTVKLLEAPDYEKVLARELDRRQKITLMQERLQRQSQAPGQEEPPSAARGLQAAAPAAARPGEEGPLTVTDKLRREIETIYPFKAAGERAAPGYGEQIENLFFAISPAVDQLLRDGYTTDQIIEALHVAADMLIPYLDAMQQAALTAGK